jgi:hypothetical protein
MEHGFFHPDKGYWQTSNYPAEKYRNAYPEGTVEIPVKPAQYHEWTGQEWVEVLPPEFDPLTHRIKKVMERNGDTFSYRYDVLELPLETAQKNVRNKRTSLLTQSDWIVPFYLEKGQPVPQEWVDYRQALRDVPDQTGFPYDVQWPEVPTNA